MLADPPALDQELFGPDGVSETIASGASLIDMSTGGDQDNTTVVAYVRS